MNYYLKLIVFFITISLYSQNNEKNYNIFIYINKNSNVIINQSENKNFFLQSFHLNWPKSSDYKKITLTVNKKNELVQEISISGASNSLILNYINNCNKNPSLKIEKENLTNIIKYEDFVYYDISSLDFIKKAKNIYVILEKDMKKNFYFAKKVEIVDSGGV